jgi:hypothetical protein
MDYNIIGYAVLTSDGFKSFETAEEALKYGNMIFPIADVEITDILDEEDIKELDIV